MQISLKPHLAKLGLGAKRRLPQPPQRFAVALLEGLQVAAAGLALLCELGGALLRSLEGSLVSDRVAG